MVAGVCTDSRLEKIEVQLVRTWHEWACRGPKGRHGKQYPLANPGFSTFLTGSAGPQRRPRRPRPAARIRCTNGRPSWTSERACRSAPHPDLDPCQPRVWAALPNLADEVGPPTTTLLSSGRAGWAEHEFRAESATSADLNPHEIQEHSSV